MNLELSKNYKSKNQQIRVMSENWVSQNMYCPCCGNSNIVGLKNNAPVADMKCEMCGVIFELKSKMGKVGRKIPDGAYFTMIERINSITNPDLLVMQYSKNYSVTDLILIPKIFFVPEIIEKRKPLSMKARRAGWIGCSILYEKIPEQGKIPVIYKSCLRNKNDVVSQYNQIKKLYTKSIETRGWLLDVLNCVNKIHNQEFNLSEMYEFIDELQAKHMNNHNIEAKIRQQLQFLRDKGFIEFLGAGHYRKIT